MIKAGLFFCCVFILVLRGNATENATGNSIEKMNGSVVNFEKNENLSQLAITDKTYYVHYIQGLFPFTILTCHRHNVTLEKETNKTIVITNGYVQKTEVSVYSTLTVENKESAVLRVRLSFVDQFSRILLCRTENYVMCCTVQIYWPFNDYKFESLQIMTNSSDPSKIPATCLSDTRTFLEPYNISMDDFIQVPQKYCDEGLPTTLHNAQVKSLSNALPEWLVKLVLYMFSSISINANLIGYCNN